MKTIFTKSFLFSIALLGVQATFSQTLPPGQAAKFGIDGDIRTDQADQGGFTAAGSHDWFKKSGGTGVGLIDTVGNKFYYAQIAAGKNFSFNKKMQYPRYSVQDGILLLDAGYARDFYGIGPVDILNDKTVFVATGQTSNKNFQDPTTWSTIPTGGTIPNKADIIDSYVNMRRDGTTITGNNPSNLILTVGATTLSTDGDHYIDFEFYKERIVYDTLTGKFSTPAPSATGGHSAWSISPGGDIAAFGDLVISFMFNNSSVSNIQLFIWTDYKTYQKGHTNRFDFVQNSWNGNSTKSGYGYAQIMPNGNYAMKAWGTVNAKTTEGPLWGTSSKDLGLIQGNYNATGYSAGQFAEAGVNLTTFGIDPATATMGMAACSPPFTRFMVKTRSSSAFSAALQDFTGPYEFLDAPTVPADINPPLTLTCSQPTQTLSLSSYLKGAYYSWSTPNGNITGSGVDSSSIKIDKAGMYYVTAAVQNGCQTTQDSVVVSEDKYKPKATAAAAQLEILPGSSVTLLGGDPLQSNYATPFGGSKGLVWNWTGPSGFTSGLQNPATTLAGTYTLTVTETRNGCTDVASTFLTVSSSTLAVKFVEFSVNADKQKKSNNLSWKVADVNEVAQFVSEKSNNGVSFQPTGYVFADGSYTAYSIKDNASEKTVYYRVKAVHKSGAVTYSSIIKVEGSSTQGDFTTFVDNAGVITIVYTSAVTEKVNIRVVSMNGQVVRETSRTVAAGTNTFKLNEVSKPVGGVYVVLLTGQSAMASAKINW